MSVTAAGAIGRPKIAIFMTDFDYLLECIQLVLVELISQHLGLLIQPLFIFYIDGGLVSHGFLSLHLLTALGLFFVFWQIVVEKLTFKVLERLGRLDHVVSDSPDHVTCGLLHV